MKTQAISLALLFFSISPSLIANGDLRTEVGPTGGRGGNHFSQNCNNSVVTGIELRAGAFIDAIKPTCDDNQYVPLTGGGGGSPAITMCPDGMFLTGLMGHSRKYVDSIKAICDSPDGGKRTHIGPMMGNHNNKKPYSLRCAPNEYVVGFFGRSGRYIDALGLNCMPIEQ